MKLFKMRRILNEFWRIGLKCKHCNFENVNPNYNEAAEGWYCSRCGNRLPNKVIIHYR